MAAKPRVLIIGAGIGGLTGALALLRRGDDGIYGYDAVTVAI